MPRQRLWQRIFLVSGIASSLLYAAMNVVVSLQWPEYSSASQTVSELSAVGAPTRSLWVILAIVDTLLVTGFGWGIRLAAGDNRRLRLVGTLIVIYGALGFLWPFAPMHLRAVLAAGGATFVDKVHVTFAGVTVAIYLLALGLAASALGRAFRLFSIASLAALAVFATLTFRVAPRVGLNQATPLIGVWERVNIGIFLLWMIVLATILLVRGRVPSLPRSPARDLGDALGERALRV